MDTLNIDTLYTILLQFTDTDLLSFSQSNKHFHNTCKSNTLYVEKLKRHYPTMVLNDIVAKYTRWLYIRLVRDRITMTNRSGNSFTHNLNAIWNNVVLSKDLELFKVLLSMRIYPNTFTLNIL